MEDFDIGINDKRNGIWLPNTELDRIPGTTTTPHKGAGLHGNAYKQHLYEKLSGVNSRKEFLVALSGIKQSLSDGMKFATVR